MHRKGSIYILEISSTRRHLRSVEPGLPWQRYNPTQRRRPLETAKSASWCPESEIIPFMCCNWFSVGAIKNWWWKGRELRTETQVLWWGGGSCLEREQEKAVVRSNRCLMRTSGYTCLVHKLPGHSSSWARGNAWFSFHKWQEDKHTHAC